MIKNKDQINGIKASCCLAADSLVYIQQFVKSGITTKQLNDLIHSYIVEHGGIPASLGYKNFPSSVCISVNDVVCHGIPDDTVLCDGDIVGIDVATILNGYYGDTCYTFAVGDVKDKLRKFLDIAKNALYVGINQVKVDNYYGNIGYEISKYIQRYDFTVCTSFTGHGTGLEFHEEPSIYHESEKNSGDYFNENEIFTIEPIINYGTPEVIIDGWIAKTQDGKVSAQYEHTVLVGKNGVEILTDSDLWHNM